MGERERERELFRSRLTSSPRSLEDSSPNSTESHRVFETMSLLSSFTGNGKAELLEKILAMVVSIAMPSSATALAITPKRTRNDDDFEFVMVDHPRFWASFLAASLVLLAWSSCCFCFGRVSRSFCCCCRCRDDEEDDEVPIYITTTGSRYHASLECRTIKGTKSKKYTRCLVCTSSNHIKAD